MKGAKGADLLDGLIRERGAFLINYAAVVSGDPSQARDLVQEAMVRVLSRTGVDQGSIRNIEAYVKATIVKLFIDDVRRKYRLARFLHLSVTADVACSSIPQIEVRQDVLSALRSVSAQQRVALIRYYFDDQPISTIAKELNCSEGNIKRHLSDGRGRLSIVLSGYEEGARS